MKQDPLSIWTGQQATLYEDANYGRGLAAYVMRKSHQIIEAPFGPAAHFGRVLEVGAGTGIHLDYVRHGFDEYVLTDASLDMLQPIGDEHEPSKITTAVEDATSLSFPDASFDRLIATHVLEHLYRPHEVLREWVRVLRPGGVLSLVLPCDPGLLWRLGRHFGPRRKALDRGLPYDYVQAREHVNPITNLVTFVRYYFTDIDEAWWPARIHSSDLNLIYAVNIRAK